MVVSVFISVWAVISAATCSVAPVLVINRSSQDFFVLLFLNEDRVVGRQTLAPGEWRWTAVLVPREGTFELQALPAGAPSDAISAGDYFTAGMPMTHVFEVSKKRVTYTPLFEWLFPEAAQWNWTIVPELIVESVPEALACPFVDEESLPIAGSE